MQAARPEQPQPGGWGGPHTEAIRALGVRVALQHCPRLGPPKSDSCGIHGVGGGAGTPSAAFMSSLFHVQLHLMDRNEQPRSGGVSIVFLHGVWLGKSTCSKFSFFLDYPYLNFLARELLFFRLSFVLLFHGAFSLQPSSATSLEMHKAKENPGNTAQNPVMPRVLSS